MLAEKIKKQLSERSAIRMAFEEGQRLEKIYGAENVFDFSIGNPEIEPPQKVKDSILLLLEKEKPLSLHSYMCDAGYEEVREKIADRLNDRFQTSFSGRNIIMSNGAAGAMNVLMYSLMDPEDEVIVMKPYYPGYASFVTNWNGKMVAVEPDPNTFYPDFDDFESKITLKTKIVIVNSPNNPTGVIYPEEVVRKIADILRKKQKEYGHCICLLADEPYRELVYTKAEVPYWTKYYENTAVAYSFSKTLSVPGERIGYLVIPDKMKDSEELIKAVRTATGMLGFVNAPSLFQKVAAECLEAKTDLNAYRNNRDMLYYSLEKLGFSMIEPEGAFYIFMRAPYGDEERLLKAAHECNILMVGGSAFGYSGYARISFCVSSDKIKRSLPAFSVLADMLELQGGRKGEN